MKFENTDETVCIMDENDNIIYFHMSLTFVLFIISSLFVIAKFLHVFVFIKTAGLLPFLPCKLTYVPSSFITS